MEQRRKRGLLSQLLLVQFAAVAALFAGVLGTSASAGTNIAAGSTTLQAGSQAATSAVVTRAAADSNFNAYDITLQFNPAVVSVASVQAASGWSLMPAPRINNAAGTVQVIAVRFDTCATSCPLFSVTWNGLAAGTSPLTLGGSANESLAGAGAYITASFAPGSVTVTAPATPSSTPTNPPSSTPSATASPSATATPSPTASPTATPSAPATPAPGAPAVIHGGGGGAASGSNFQTTTTVTLGNGGSRTMPQSFDITLTFDPGVATIQGLTAGDGWAFAPQPVIDNAAGTVRASGLRFSDCAATCPLFTLAWQSVAKGVTQLRIAGEPGTVLGAYGVNLPAVYTPGTIVITPGQGPKTPATTTPSAGSNENDVPVMPHSPGWNLLTWGGEEMSPQQALSASDPGAIEVIYVWDAAAGKWRRYGPGLPGYLNDLKTLKSGDIIWLSAKN